MNRHLGCSCSRRDFLVRGMYGLGVGAGLPLILNRTSAALAAQALDGTSVEKHPNRILVVVELSGGNDGLNTVVPFGDAAYYRARPKLGIKESETIKIADGFGFQLAAVHSPQELISTVLLFERIIAVGRLAIHRARANEAVQLLDGLRAIAELGGQPVDQFGMCR